MLQLRVSRKWLPKLYIFQRTLIKMTNLRHWNILCKGAHQKHTTNCSRAPKNKCTPLEPMIPLLIVCRRKSQNLLAPLSVIIKKMCRSFSKNSPYYSHFNNRSWAVAYICLLAPHRNPLCRRRSNAENQSPQPKLSKKYTISEAIA